MKSKFELRDGSYSILDIQNYFEYIFKDHGENTDNSSISVYVNKIKNRITFKTKTRYYLELLCLKQWNCLEALKIKQPKAKIFETFHLTLRLQR